MARADLSNLLGAIDRKDTAPDSREVATVETITPSPSPETPSSTTPKEIPLTNPEPDSSLLASVDSPSKPSAPVTPRTFEDFERKEARLRRDQYETLTINARRLNKLKGVGGVRITENTLIRVALDMLIARMPDLSGATEEELRSSVGL